MAVIEWLAWAAVVCLVFWLYQAVDLARILARDRQKPPPVRVPHWARTGHLPPHKHGRHARR